MMRARTVFLLSLLLLLAAGPAAEAQVVIVQRNVNLRTTPSSALPPIRLLLPPVEAALLDPEQHGGYYHVRTVEGEEGWVWTRNVRVDLDRALDLPVEIPAYDRGEWRHWIDADGNCRNTRQEVLIRDSQVPVTFRAEPGGRECFVIAGRWVDPYSGETFGDPRALDIDHMVPLQNAHLSGGWRWDADRKRDFANDLEFRGHLLPVKASLNRSKGHKGPDAWVPPDTTFWCDYGRIWETIKFRWQLTMTTAEAARVDSLKARCAP